MRLVRTNSKDGRQSALRSRGSRGESRSNALWGRGGRKAGAAVAALATALALAASATAGGPGGHQFSGYDVQGLGRVNAYIPDSHCHCRRGGGVRCVEETRVGGG
jgi:hypothetical protein